MSSRDVRSYRRLFTTTELDLNRAPSTQQQVAMIDLDAIDDDDVVESSPTAIAQVYPQLLPSSIHYFILE